MTQQCKVAFKEQEQKEFRSMDEEGEWVYLFNMNMLIVISVHIIV